MSAANHTPTLAEQIEKMVRARLNGLDVLGKVIAGREIHVRECDAIIATLRSHAALVAALEQALTRIEVAIHREKDLDVIGRHTAAREAGAAALKAAKGEA